MRRRKLMMEGCDRDLREHREMKTQDDIARGTSPHEAHYAAVRKVRQCDAGEAASARGVDSPLRPDMRHLERFR